MSIYSGFATRSLESSYNKCIGEILLFYQSYLLVYLKKGKIHTDLSDKSYCIRTFLKLYNSLKTFEQQKHLKPMFSLYCTELADYLKNLNEYSLGPLPFKNTKPYYSVASNMEFSIFNDGLAYDDSRIQRFTPSRLETVSEKPRLENISREKTQKIIHLKNSPIKLSTFNTIQL